MHQTLQADVDQIILSMHMDWRLSRRFTWCSILKEVKRQAEYRVINNDSGKVLQKSLNNFLCWNVTISSNFKLEKTRRNSERSTCSGVKVADTWENSQTAHKVSTKASVFKFFALLLILWLIKPISKLKEWSMALRLEHIYPISHSDNKESDHSISHKYLVLNWWRVRRIGQ